MGFYVTVSLSPVPFIADKMSNAKPWLSVQRACVKRENFYKIARTVLTVFASQSTDVHYLSHCDFRKESMKTSKISFFKSFLTRNI